MQIPLWWCLESLPADREDRQWIRDGTGAGDNDLEIDDEETDLMVRWNARPEPPAHRGTFEEQKATPKVAFRGRTIVAVAEDDPFEIEVVRLHGTDGGVGGMEQTKSRRNYYIHDR
jgi:hypothetical protein